VPKDCERANQHHYIHQDGEYSIRVDEFGDDDEVMISTHFEDEEFPYSGEVFDMEEVAFLHNSLGRILNDER
jgi:hypothetical protein